MEENQAEQARREQAERGWFRGAAIGRRGVDKLKRCDQICFAAAAGGERINI
jgi:hypothetical protein